MWREKEEIRRREKQQQKQRNRASLCASPSVFKRARWIPNVPHPISVKLELPHRPNENRFGWPVRKCWIKGKNHHYYLFAHINSGIETQFELWSGHWSTRHVTVCYLPYFPLSACWCCRHRHCLLTFHSFVGERIKYEVFITFDESVNSQTTFSILYRHPRGRVRENRKQFKLNNRHTYMRLNLQAPVTEVFIHVLGLELVCMARVLVFG